MGEPGLRTQGDLERAIEEFDSFDRGSYTFRYTVKTDGESPSLEDPFEFDLYFFASIMEAVIERVAYIPEIIREKMQERWQAAYEAQQEAWANADYDLSSMVATMKTNRVPSRMRAHLALSSPKALQRTPTRRSAPR